MSGWETVLVAASITAVTTGLGALPFLVVTAVTTRTVACAKAIAAGLMMGASFGLVAEGAAAGAAQTVSGGVAGVVFMLLTQRWLAHREVAFGGITGASARQMFAMVVVMTVHSFAEGVAVGVSFGGGATLATAITVAIAVHNIPEGLAISAVLRPGGQSVWRCALWSIFSSVPQPLTAVPAFFFVERVRPALPYGLGFAAGAMLAMVLVELLPEAFEDARRATVAVAASLSLVAMVAFQGML